MSEITEQTRISDARVPKQVLDVPSPVALNEAYPRSWWAVAFSHDVRPGRVVPARLFERDVVLWRESSGLLHCMAAYCPHLGAHLGIGGEVLNDQLQCPFHGWRYDGDGCLAAVPGSQHLRGGVFAKTYRIVEQFGVIFLWNGEGEPDIDFPDFAAELGVAKEDITPWHWRALLPSPVRLFAENNADGMHFAFTHDTGGWIGTRIVAQTPTYMHFEHELHDTRKWFSWGNLRRRIAKRELANMMAPVTVNPSIKTWGGTIHMVSFAGQSSGLSSSLFAMTPVEADSCYIIVVAFLPRIPVPILGAIAKHILGYTINMASWTVIRQDLALLSNRKEPANPPYSREDKGLIAFRRMWDSRIVAGGVLDGEDPRYNGRRAGINLPRKSPAQ